MAKFTSGLKVSFQGQRSLFHRINPNKNYSSTIGYGVNKVGRELLRTIKQRAPKDSGNLKQSINGFSRSRYNQFLYSIIIDATRSGSNINYAWLVEGLVPVKNISTKNNKPRSILRPSTKQAKFGRDLYARYGKTYKPGQIIYFHKTSTKYTTTPFIFASMTDVILKSTFIKEMSRQLKKILMPRTKKRGRPAN